MKVNVIHSESAYETRRPWMSKTKTGVEYIYSRSAYGIDKQHTNNTNTGPFIYPVIRYVYKNGEPDFYWSSRNDRGHFGIPKVIFGCMYGIGAVFIDRKGEYGMTQFCSAIADEPENLDNIAKAMKSQKFLDLMSYTTVDTRQINNAFLKELRHDFWREFV